MNEVPQAFNETGVQIVLLLLGWSAVGLLVLGLLAFLLLVRFDLDDMGIAAFVSLFSAVFGVIAGGIWLLALIPYDGKYHHYYEVSGHVDSVSNVIAEADDGLTRQPVVTLDNVDRPLVIDDPRAVSLLDADVTLRCSIEWNYQAADSYSCRIVNFDTTTD